MRFTIAVIEDNPFSQELIIEILSSDPKFDLEVFETPTEFLLKGSNPDLIISDWNFGHVSLEFFLKDIDSRKLIIFTGSIIVFNVECIAVLHKISDAHRVVEIARAALMRSRSY